MSEVDHILRPVIDRIFNCDTISLHDNAWNELFVKELLFEEISDLISLDEIRLLKQNGLHKIRNLILIIINILELGINEALYETLSTETSQKLVTSIRFLIRLMPFILEDHYDEDVKRLLWERIDDTEEISFLSSSNFNDDPSQDVFEFSNTIGCKILSSLNRLLFLPQFTVNVPPIFDASEKPSIPKHIVDIRLLWKSGVGASSNLIMPNLPNKMIKMRIEVLKCVIVCLSESLFVPVDSYQKNIPLWIRLSVSGYLPYTANLFSSLFSTVFTHNPPVNKGIPIIGSVLFSKDDDEELILLSTQLLLILIDFNPSIFSPESISYYEEDLYRDGTKSDNGIRNVYRTMVIGVQKDCEIDLIYDGLCNILEKLMNHERSFFKKGIKLIEYSQELLMLFWHLLTINRSFLIRINLKSKGNRILVPMLYILLKNSIQQNDAAGQEALTISESFQDDTPANKCVMSKRKASNRTSKMGFSHMCAFIILVLSADREFSVGLNDPYTGKFPLEISIFQGSCADLCLLVIHKVVVNNLNFSKSDSFIEILLTILCNISAYVKSFCVESCLKLMNLFYRLSHPIWLFKTERRYHCIFFLLDILNNLIQYQYEGNLRLIYSILRRKELFLDLQNISLPSKLISMYKQSDLSSKADSEKTGNASTAATIICTDVDLKNDSHQGDNNEWIPTHEWLNEWKTKLPLQSVIRLITYLSPQVEAECTEKGLVDQEEALKFLAKSTMVGLLPVPHPIIIRNYQSNIYTSLWLTSYTWGLVFTKIQKYATYEWDRIKLIHISLVVSDSTI